MKRFSVLIGLILVLSAFSFGQMRPVGPPTTSTATSVPSTPSFEAKYEGGMFGYSTKESGTLRFDDENKRVVFHGKDQKEKFSIAYNAFMVIYPQSKSVTSTTGNVVRHIPLPGAGLAGLLKEKRRYLIIQFEDPDVDVRGIVSFKLSNKKVLESVIQTMGSKANLTKRGEAFYRPRVATDEI